MVGAEAGAIVGAIVDKAGQPANYCKLLRPPAPFPRSRKEEASSLEWGGVYGLPPLRSPGLSGQRRAGARRPGGGRRACRRDGGLRVAEEEEETRVTIGDPKMGTGVKGNGPQIGTNIIPKRPPSRPQVIPKGSPKDPQRIPNGSHTFL